MPKEPTQKQLDHAKRLGIEEEALEGLDRSQLSRVLTRKMREGGREKLKNDYAERRRELIEEKGLKPGLCVTHGPRTEDSEVLHVKGITPDHHVTLEEHPFGRFSPGRLYPVEEVPAGEQ